MSAMGPIADIMATLCGTSANKRRNRVLGSILFEHRQQPLGLLVIGFYRLAERAQDRHRDISRRQKQSERGTLLGIGTFSYGLLWQCAGCDPCLWQTFPPVPCALAPATVAKSAKAIIMIFISSLLVRAQASMRRPGSSSGIPSKPAGSISKRSPSVSIIARLFARTGGFSVIRRRHRYPAYSIPRLLRRRVLRPFREPRVGLGKAQAMA